MCRAARASPPAAAGAAICSPGLVRRVGALIKIPMARPQLPVRYKYKGLSCGFQLVAPRHSMPQHVSSDHHRARRIATAPALLHHPAFRTRASGTVLPSSLCSFADHNQASANIVPAGGSPLEMFGFGKSIKDPLADAKTAERWLSTFPANDPLAAHSAILTELGALSERTAHRAPARLEAVFRLDVQSEALRRTLTSQYHEHGIRSSRVESQLWQAMFDLTQGFLLCYQAFAREVSDHAQSNRWRALLPELIARQIVHHGLDAKVRLYRYEQWIPARWSDLH